MSALVTPRVEASLWPERETLLFAAAVAAVLLPIFFYTWSRGEPLQVLHYTDERLHYGLIHEYAEGRFPVDGKAYSSATTPFFHLTLAPLDALGASRWVLRLANLSIVLVFSAIVFADLRRAGGRVVAWLGTGTVVASPYMAARGFVLLTENYSYLWFWLAARPWLLPGSRGPRSPLVAAVLLSLAALTRQSWLWACPFLALAATRDFWAPRLASGGRLAGGLSGFPVRTALPFLLPIAACLPFFVVWGGFVPQNWHDVNQARGLNAKAIAFSFALLGLYLLVVGPSRLPRLCAPRRLAVVAPVALFVGIVSGLRHESLFTDGGFIWFISDRFPELFGASTLLVGLLAVGLSDVLGGRRRARRCLRGVRRAVRALVCERAHVLPKILRGSAARDAGGSQHPWSATAC